MGGVAALHFGLAYPSRALAAGCWRGLRVSTRRAEKFREEALIIAATKLEKEGMAVFAETRKKGPMSSCFGVNE